jgi:cbb3-type cytochrome oxidase subunit 3
MKEIFANPDIGLIGLLFFFLFFCGIAIWTFRPSAKKSHQKHAQIPLQETEQ